MTEVVPAPSPYGNPNDPSQFGDQAADSSRHVDADYADSVSDQASISAYYVQTHQDEDPAAKVAAEDAVMAEGQKTEEEMEAPVVPPEKVSTLESPIVGRHTSFYPQIKH